MKTDIFELDYTKINVAEERKGAKQLKNIDFTRNSKSIKGNTLKNLFGLTDKFTIKDLLAFQKRESSKNKNKEPSRLIADRQIYYKGKQTPFVEIILTKMVEQILSQPGVDIKAIKFVKGTRKFYIDYREDIEDKIEDMSKNLIQLFGGKGGVDSKTVMLGGITKTFKVLGRSKTYTSSKVEVRLRVFTIKGGVIPTEIQETGTTIILNAVLRKNIPFPTADSILEHEPTQKGLERVFGTYKDRLKNWTHTYFEQQRSILDINKFADSSWAEFVYGDKSFTKFFTDMIKDAKRSDGTKVEKYTEWNPSDIWAAHRLKTLQDEIEEQLKDGANVVSKINNLLRGYFDRNELIGLSLKKISDDKEAHVAFYNNNVKDLKLKIIEEYAFDDLIFNLKSITQPNKGTVYVYYGSDRKFTLSLTRTSGGTLSINSKIKGAAAQAGQAIIAMVVNLLKKKLKGKKMMFNKDKSSPMYVDSWDNWVNLDSKYDKEYLKMYEFLKPHFENPPKDFHEFLDGALKETTDPRNFRIKLMQIRFFYDVFSMKSDDDIIEFWQDLLYLAMKIDRGSRFEFAPFAKISDV